MQRHGSIARLRPNRYEEYKRLHADTWPGVLETIAQCNIRNYSIYYKDGLLFSYFEYIGEDFEADMAKMAADETTREWWEICTPCLESHGPRSESKWWAAAEEVFHTD